MSKKDLLLSLSTSLIPLVGVLFFSADYAYIIYTYTLELLVLAAFLYRSESSTTSFSFSFFIPYWLFAFFLFSIFTVILTNLPAFNSFANYGRGIQSSPFYIQILFMVTRPEVILSICVYIGLQVYRTREQFKASFDTLMIDQQETYSKKVGKEIIVKIIALTAAFMTIAVIGLLYMHPIIAITILLIMDGLLTYLISQDKKEKLNTK